MKKHIVDEKTGISYTLQGDYYLPDFEVPKNEYVIGKFGRRHLQYLKDQHPAIYSSLLLSGKLNRYLYSIDVKAREMFDHLAKEYAAAQGITKQLKAENQMEWVRRMNNIRACAEEVVSDKILYKK